MTEYWLVDLEQRTLTVFAFDSDRVARIGGQQRHEPPRIYRDGEHADTSLGVVPLAELLPQALDESAGGADGVATWSGTPPRLAALAQR